MTEITMPRLSDSMEEGTILRWLVEDGAAVARGDEIAEIETDKANMTYEADAAGTFQRVAAEGDTLPVGALIASVLSEGEDPTPRQDASPDAAAPATPSGASVLSEGQRVTTVQDAAPGPSAVGGATPAGPEPAAAAPSMPVVGDGSGPEARVKA